MIAKPSYGMFMLLAALHFLVSAVAAISGLGAVLSAGPMTDPRPTVSAIQAFLWIWLTGPMLLAWLLSGGATKVIIPAAFAWSLLMGFLGSLIVAQLRRRP